jgi:hypothetical protein
MDFAQKAQFFTLDVISDIAFGGIWVSCERQGHVFLHQDHRRYHTRYDLRRRSTLVGVSPALKTIQKPVAN